MKPADAAPLIRRWFDEYDRSVVTTLRRCGVRSAADCADLKQEVFTTAFFALLRGTVIDAPKAWLKACARKKASNYRVTEGRRALPARGGEAVSITPSPAQLVEDREVMLLVLACLDEELQDIVLAFRVDGLFWDEIAAERGITVDSARHQYKMAITLMTEAWKREDAKSGKRRWVPFPILLTQVFDAFRAEVDSDSPELDRRVRETLDRLMEEAGACDPDPESERVSVATLSPPTIQITLPPAPPTPGGMVLGVLGNVIVIGVFIAFLIRGTTPENPLSELTHA